MMPRTDMEHLPWPIREEILRVVGMLFEASTEATKGNLSDQNRRGRIIKLLLHGPHAQADWQDLPPGEAIHLLAIVNHPRLARQQQRWHVVRDRLRRAWEFGEIAQPVRLTVNSLEQVNHALAQGTPHFVTIATEGIALYEFDRTPLKMPRHLPASERRARGLAEYTRWLGRAADFLLGAAFFQDQGSAPMAALLLHQACEHLYQCVIWSLSLHGPRIHALDELREMAEILDQRLYPAWPRDTPFERRAFGCIRRAYVEVRYGRNYRISGDELTWAMERAVLLPRLVQDVCCGHLDATDAVNLEARHVVRA